MTDIDPCCPHLTVLASSRAALRVSVEHEFPVLPLELPDPRRPASVAVVAEAPAMVFFIERARSFPPLPARRAGYPRRGALWAGRAGG